MVVSSSKSSVTGRLENEVEPNVPNKLVEVVYDPG